MRIKIIGNAKSVYLGRCNAHRQNCNWEWAAILKSIEGQSLEVETKHLFRDQYNTVPLTGISDNGLRIMDCFVESIEDDARPGQARCQYCGETFPLNSAHPCEAKYIKAF